MCHAFAVAALLVRFELVNYNGRNGRARGGTVFGGKRRKILPKSDCFRIIRTHASRASAKVLFAHAMCERDRKQEPPPPPPCA